MPDKTKAFAFLKCPQPKSSLAETLLRVISGYQRISRKRIFSLNKEEIAGYLINSPQLEQGRETFDEHLLLDSLVKADALARKLGALILGVDGFVDQFSDKWEKVCQRIKIPLTTGRALFAWSVFEAIYRTARIKRLELSKANVAILGATTATAALCSKKLSAYVYRLVLFDLDQGRLSKLSQTISAFGPAQIVLAHTLEEATKGADILVIDPQCYNGPLPLENLNPGGIICNIFLPWARQLQARPLQGQTVVNAGLIKLPEPNKLKLCRSVDKNIVSAAIAETMLLTFENNFSDFSGTADTNLDKLEEIADIAVRHGFEVWVPEAPVL
jgi:predicted amino acid dehydrogenase